MSITFNSREEAKEYIDNLFGNKTGIIIKEGNKYIVKVIDNSNLECPFCKTKGFDKIGLKSHLEHGDCNDYNETEGLNRIY